MHGNNKYGSIYNQGNRVNPGVESPPPEDDNLPLRWLFGGLNSKLSTPQAIIIIF